MYVDDWITGQDTREAALFHVSRHAKNIMQRSREWRCENGSAMYRFNGSGGRLKVSTFVSWMHPSGKMSPHIQELWIKITWDEILPTKVEREKWLIWCKELPLLDNLRIQV
ncbi:hypothetical protein TNCV_626991 [Trichonephila clavipes]|nr:hypothetical protein TNCV_626991 [Trichonephila clavipes]